MKKFCFVFSAILLMTSLSCQRKQSVETNLAQLASDFAQPPREAGIRCWWWWLNSNVTKASITRDLEAMHDKGYSGAMIFDAGTELWWGPDNPVPNGPMFSSPEWTELYLHALDEAKRLDLELGLSIQSGWNLGGPTVTLEQAAKQLTWSEVQATSDGSIEKYLPIPENNDDYYRDICVLAYPTPAAMARKPIDNLAAKTGVRELGGSAPDCRFLLNDIPAEPGEQDARLQDIVNITAHMSTDGKLIWDAPPGKWTILRLGYTPTKAHVATSSDNWKGHVLDYLSADAFNQYWDEVVDPLLQAAGAHAGTTLKNLETDSWECGGMNWSPGFDEEFKKYRGYDPILYLPIVAGKIIENREVSNAFLSDLRKTIAACVSDNHYKIFAERAAEYNMGIQPESSGPHAGPMDGIKNYSHSAITMSEFWIPSPHRPGPEKRFFVKQAASAAHIYGKQLVAAESFTSLRKPHWSDVLWQELKPAMDHEFCSGLNLIYVHTFTNSPQEMGIPGQEYFAGTHMNPQVTWWEYSDTFIDYMSRVQLVTQRGKFVADVLHYYGDHVPNIAARKESDPAGVLPGYDYDTTNEDVLLQLKVVDGEIVVPGGIRYRMLSLPDHKVLSFAVLVKLEALLHDGATISGPKPERLVSQVGGESAQQQFHELADKLWGKQPGEQGQATIGKGKLVWGYSAHELLQELGIPQDFQLSPAQKTADFDYIHYTIGSADVYFVSNQEEKTQKIEASFRVAGKQPHIWDPVTGSTRQANAFDVGAEQTTVPLQFEPHESYFIVFDGEISDTSVKVDAVNFPERHTIAEIAGPWQVSFDTSWGGPQSVEFAELMDWTQSENPGIKHYSGPATYSTGFEMAQVAEGARYWLTLNEVAGTGIAAIELNGNDVGTVWTKPFRVDISGALQTGNNQLKITVVNNWINRLIGDRGKPQQEQFTRTNIKIRDDWHLQPSGLLGPVQIQCDRCGQ